MKRRTFLQLSLAAAGLSKTVVSCAPRKRIKGNIIGGSAHIGHLLRDKKFTEPATTEKKKLVIVGGGVSGLSAARYLNRLGLNDFVVLDLEKKMGGNSVSGKNEISAYPWAAHYIPTPNNSLTEYIEFLKESGVVTGFNDSGLPIYNDYHLCFDPQDRLYINGLWQEGLIPNYGVGDADKKQIEQFLQLMEEYRYKKGTDGKDAFAIPVDNSSKDEMFTYLDTITMKEWMLKNNFKSDYLHWYVNYCTRDDFGTTHDKASAWVGIHYFASRKGKGANAEHHDVITWPEGNHFLIKHLDKGIKNNLKTDSLVVRVALADDGINIDYYDVASKELKRIEAEQCIIAVPQFIAARLLHDENRINTVKQHYQYMPWMVANLTVKKLEERSGAPLSWDNVVYDSDSLGYVEATHELLQQNIPRKNLTYYLPLTKKGVAEERKKAQSKTHEEWVRLIVADLKKVHPNIEDAVEKADIMVWGHAMVQPLPGMIHGDLRNKLSASISDKIHFAHTDLAGLSIFEEGFYQGLNAAKKVVNLLS